MTQITHETALGDFYHQIDFALSSYKKHNLKLSQFSNILIAGLGGSGIGGRITRNYFLDKMPIPVEVYSDYKLPAYTSDKTLVILSSYSGLTEETLAMYEEAAALGCKMICISSGGTLLEWSKRDSVIHYEVETGFQPRMALGFSLSFLLQIFSELLDTDISAELKSCSRIYSNAFNEQDRAMEMLDHFNDRLDHKFVIMADNPLEAVGVRLCQQIQENAKIEAFINVLPEANHNAFETYYGILPSNFIFMNSNTNHRNNGRFAYLQQLLERQGNLVYRIDLGSNSLLEIFRTIYMTDWFSIYLSNRKGADNMSVPNISGLKNFLLTYK